MKSMTGMLNLILFQMRKYNNEKVKMEQNVEIKAGGLKCDNPKCDWWDDTISTETYSQWINKPCPKCGDNLLTLEDFQRAEQLLAVAHLMNSMPKELLESLSNLTPEETIEALKDSPMFKDAKGLDELSGNEKVRISFETHKEIKASEIKKSE